MQALPNPYDYYFHNGSSANHNSHFPPPRADADLQRVLEESKWESEVQQRAQAEEDRLELEKAIHLSHTDAQRRDAERSRTHEQELLQAIRESERLSLQKGKGKAVFDPVEEVERQQLEMALADSLNDTRLFNPYINNPDDEHFTSVSLGAEDPAFDVEMTEQPHELLIRTQSSSSTRPLSRPLTSRPLPRPPPKIHSRSAPAVPLTLSMQSPLSPYQSGQNFEIDDPFDDSHESQESLQYTTSRSSTSPTSSRPSAHHSTSLPEFSILSSASSSSEVSRTNLDAQRPLPVNRAPAALSVPFSPYASSSPHSSLSHSPSYNESELTRQSDLLDEDLEDVRIGFSAITEHLHSGMTFPDVVEISSQPDIRLQTFCFQAKSYRSLLKYLMWHGEAIISAGINDISASEKALEMKLVFEFYSAQGEVSPFLRLCLTLQNKTRMTLSHSDAQPRASIAIPITFPLPISLKVLAMKLASIQKAAKSCGDMNGGALYSLDREIESLAQLQGEQTVAVQQDVEKTSYLYNKLKSFRKKHTHHRLESVDTVQLQGVLPEEAHYITPFSLNNKSL